VSYVLRQRFEWSSFSRFVLFLRVLRAGVAYVLAALYPCSSSVSLASFAVVPPNGFGVPSPFSEDGDGFAAGIWCCSVIAVVLEQAMGVAFSVCR
jgi:hypothetical protein